MVPARPRQRRQGERAKERPLEGKTLAMVFDKPSTRTRVSFDVGMRELGGESILGPYILGLDMPVQIAPMTASASDLVTLAVLAAVGVRSPERKASRARRS